MFCQRLFFLSLWVKKRTSKNWNEGLLGVTKSLPLWEGIWNWNKEIGNCLVGIAKEKREKRTRSAGSLVFSLLNVISRFNNLALTANLVWKEKICREAGENAFKENYSRLNVKEKTVFWLTVFHWNKYFMDFKLGTFFRSGVQANQIVQERILFCLSSLVITFLYICMSYSTCIFQYAPH